jgi:hypothetical protein
MQQTLKAYFQRMSADGLSARDPQIPVMFNPTDFSITKGSQLAEMNIGGLATPLQQFVRGTAAKLSVKLFFDTTDQGGGVFAQSVTAQTDKFLDLVTIEAKTHAPPICKFVWGSKFPTTDLTETSQSMHYFVGVVESIQQEYTLFSPQGIPLRATLTVAMREFKTLSTQREQLRLNSPDRTHSHIVARGDTLSSIAASVYGDPGQWRPLADHNHLTDPRKLSVGAVLEVPPLDQGVAV